MVPPPRRHDAPVLLELAFGLLDKDGSGKITKEDLAGAYDFSQNPEVISGEMTEDDAAMLFLSNFERSSVDGIVTMAEFVEYYRDISAEIDDDEYFELMVGNAWHVATGGGDGGDGGDGANRAADDQAVLFGAPPKLKRVASS